MLFLRKIPSFILSYIISKTNKPLLYKNDKTLQLQDPLIQITSHNNKHARPRQTGKSNCLAYNYTINVQRALIKGLDDAGSSGLIVRIKSWVRLERYCHTATYDCDRECQFASQLNMIAWYLVKCQPVSRIKIWEENLYLES